MENEEHRNRQFALLRKKAEDLLAESPDKPSLLAVKEIKDLIHDLSVYQIELEIQNEELRKAQNLLESTRNQYMRLYHQAPIGYLSLDKNAIILQVNETFASMLGIASTALQGKALGNYIDEADARAFYGRYNAFFKNPLGKNLDVKFLKEPSGSFYGRITGSVEKADGAPEITTLLAAVSDITLERESETALKESEQKFRSFIELSEDAIVLTDESGAITEWNIGAEHIFGMPRSQALGSMLWDVQYQFAPAAMKTDEIYQRMKAALTQHLANGKGAFLNRLYENSILTLNGQEKIVQGLVTVIPTRKGYQLGSILRDVTEQRSMEAKLKESQERYRRLAENAEDLIYRYAFLPEPHFDYVNPAATAITGYTPEDHYNNPNLGFELVHPDDLWKLQQLAQSPQAAAEPLTLRWVRKDGKVIWTEQRNVPVFNEKGEMIALEGIARDITARKEAEEAIRLHAARLQSLLNISQAQVETQQELLDYALQQVLELTGSKVGYIYYYDEDSQIFTLNTWSKEVMDACKVAEPQTVYELQKTGLWGEAVRQRKAIIVNDFQAPNEYKKGYPPGHVELMRFATVPIFSGGHIVAVVGVGNKESDYTEFDVMQMTLTVEAVWAIGERKYAEMALRESERKFRSLFENMTEGVALFDLESKSRQFRLSDANPAFQAHIGIEIRDALGKEMSELIPELAWERFSTEEKIYDSLAEVYHAKTGKHLRVLAFSPQPGRLALITEDITRRKSIENSLLATQKMAALGTLVAGVAHEINTPLQIITGASSNLLDKCKCDMLDAHKAASKLEAIQRSGWKIAEIIRSLRIYAHGASQGTLVSPVNLNSLVQDNLAILLAPLERNPAVTLRTELADSLPEILCAPDQISQVLIQLVENAVEALETGSEIVLRTRMDETGQGVTLEVEDNGTGIPLEIQQKVFDPFFTTKPLGKGSGLGLSVAAGIIRSYGGDIRLRSQPGKGACFTVLLPLQPPADILTPVNGASNGGVTGRYDE